MPVFDWLKSHGTAPVAGGVVIVAILLFMFLTGRGNEGQLHSAGTTYGRILVDSPEVYTRERMVNDRFNEEAWLQARLKELEKPSIQGVVRAQKTSKRSADISVAQKEETRTADEDPGSDEPRTAGIAGTEQDEENTSETEQPQVTPIETFRGYQSFREEVRNAIIENQLDDRHDLGGNTLYRLKFDASIIPGNDTSAWASIKVSISRDKNLKKEGEEVSDVYQFWMTGLQKQINAEIDADTDTDLKDKGGSEKEQSDSNIYKDGFRLLNDDLEHIPEHSLIPGKIVPEDFNFQSECWKSPATDKASGKDSQSATAKASVKDRQSGDSKKERVPPYDPGSLECLMLELAERKKCKYADCRAWIVGQQEQEIRREALSEKIRTYGAKMGLDESSIGQTDTAPMSQKQATRKRLVTFGTNDDGTKAEVTEFTETVSALPVPLTEQERETFRLNRSEKLVFYAVPSVLNKEQRDAGQKLIYAVPEELSDAERDAFQRQIPDAHDSQILEGWDDILACEQVRIRVSGRELRICDHEAQLLEEFTVDINAQPIEINYEVGADFDGQPVFYLKRSEQDIRASWTSYLDCEDMVRVQVADGEYQTCRSMLHDLGIPTKSVNEPIKVDAELAVDSSNPFYLPPTLVLTGKPADERIRETWATEMDCADKGLVRTKEGQFRVCRADLELIQTAASEDSEDATGAGNAGSEEEFVDVKDDLLNLSDDRWYDGQPRIVLRAGFAEFQRMLEKFNEPKFLFSYAVTPKESSQQLASSSRLAVAEQLKSDASGILAGAGIVADFGSASEFSEHARIMERRPVVVGIASHKYLRRQEEKQIAEFGWLIGPKLVVGSDGLTTFRHLPSQNSLAAIVSAPAWWRSADVVVETGWVDKDGELLDKQASSVTYSITLPGDTDEITSELLLDGQRPGPEIKDVEPKSLKAGCHARILIEGQNLWRSTVVTIGAQRSTRIFVLPNMRGIIAEFDEDDAQASGSGTDQKVALRVWTSEGVDNWKGGLTVVSNSSCP